MELSRRNVLAAGLGLGLAAALEGHLLGADTRSRAYASARAMTITGTTLEQSVTSLASRGYTRLTAGPALALQVRTDLAQAVSGRDDRRTALASFVQFTDLHVVDAQSPMRVEWLAPITGSAFRPHEALATQGNTSLVRRVNALKKGPFTSRPFDCVVTTGDNIDNAQEIELEWFLRVMSGGPLTPSTGDPTRWEGVQTRNNPSYWTPETSLQDTYKKAGFPQIPGYFSRAMASFASPGLNVPWLCVFGNHDDLTQGTLVPSDDIRAKHTSNLKLLGPSSPTTARAMSSAMARGELSTQDVVAQDLLTVEVTPDPRRRVVSPREFMAAHLDPSATGPGPHGHGFTANNLETNRAYYTFQIAPGITGIALDTTNRAGLSDGSLDHAQWGWLETTLVARSSRYFDVWGRQLSHDVSDELFVVFSHHSSTTMGNILLPFDGTGIRHIGPEFVGLLKRFPNVVAWVNGHTHENKITAHGHADPRRQFWEINTASHIDFPQHARILEVVDNHDKTLSLFTTIIESQAPLAANYEDGSPEALASLYRELAFNEQRRRTGGNPIGTPGDLNTELLLAHPWK